MKFLRIKDDNCDNLVEAENIEIVVEEDCCQEKSKVKSVFKFITISLVLVIIGKIVYEVYKNFKEKNEESISEECISND